MEPTKKLNKAKLVGKTYEHVHRNNRQNTHLLMNRNEYVAQTEGFTTVILICMKLMEAKKANKTKTKTATEKPTGDGLELNSW